MKKKVAIIGGGASGLVCAIVAAREGCDVTIIEKNKKIGRKILATGNGRCNISNTSITADNFHSTNPSFVLYALKNFTFLDLERFFSDIGLDFIKLEDKRVFPMSLQAASVVEFLFEECTREGVRIYCNLDVKEVRKSDKFIVSCEEKTFRFDKVVVATGSIAMPKLGGSGIGYEIARSFGHVITPLFASLVQLKSDDPFCKSSSGVKIEAALRIFVNNELKKEISGDLLFTDYGVSGLAVLDISRAVSYALQKDEIPVLKIDLMPFVSLSSLKNVLKKKSQKFHDKPISLWLNGILHKKLVLSIIKRLGFDEKKALGMKDIQKLSYEIKNLSIKITDTNGAKSAEVIAGGVKCSQIDSKTMESKLQKGLYFIGEVVDVDGDRGGYNLHWAFASGFLAGRMLCEP